MLSEAAAARSLLSFSLIERRAAGRGVQSVQHADAIRAPEPFSRIPAGLFLEGTQGQEGVLEGSFYCIARSAARTGGEGDRWWWGEEEEGGLICQGKGGLLQRLPIMGNAGSMDSNQTEFKAHNMPLKLPMPEPGELEERFAVVLVSSAAFGCSPVCLLMPTPSTPLLPCLS